ncbi:flavin reductase family protein [Paraburkholderia dinghuensis]|uniref:Flavin reductase n=1 Tax=Paraburkholderia dinghuensis TaxID=2305225 RepID=A0A3N6MM33_9BURK|nr:flavin reductase family protein [Paraburkholderia dinghuensis]RQH04884.1 flavin reductase [Paraburkholderia dinghuensis]
MNARIEQMRDLAGCLAQGVVLATTRDNAGRELGQIVTGLSVVSLDPPIVMWSTQGQLSGASGLSPGHPLVLNLLAQNQAWLLGLFNQARAQRLDNIGRGPGPDGMPEIEGCTAWLGCRVLTHHDGEDHTVVIVEVQTITVTDQPPLGLASDSVLTTGTAGDQFAEALGPASLSHLLARAYYQLRLGYLPELARQGLSEAQYFLMGAAALNPGSPAERLERLVAVSGHKVGSSDWQRLARHGLLEMQGERAGAVPALTDAGHAVLMRMAAVSSLNEARATADFDTSRVQWLKEQLMELIHGTRSHWQAPDF